MHGGRNSIVIQSPLANNVGGPSGRVLWRFSYWWQVWNA